jgi:predicted kinase
MLSLILLRGLPGAGKTSLANVLSDNGYWPVFSVDDYFTDTKTGDYHFEFEKNHLAYKNCLQKTENALKQKTEKVFIDNTLTLDWEIEPYFKLASEHGYKVYTVTVENRHHGKNKHGVNEEQLKKMAEKYKIILM